MTASLAATRPTANATVHASAGTGKTWLLVTRLVRLLLSGIEPGRILAVTFTRKAAAEMLERLTERLRALALATEGELTAHLEQMGVDPTPEARAEARRLYEAVLLAEHNLRATTFHAFCQEILQRFPLEAGVPPGFELLENEGNTRALAWDALYARATQAPESDLARALDGLMAHCGGLANVQAALDSFLDHRIDWWAYTAGAPAPVAYAADALLAQLDLDPDADPLADFFTAARCEALAEYHELLLKHPTATHQRQAAALAQALDAGRDNPQRLEALRAGLLTQAGTPVKRSMNKTLAGRLGEAGAERLLNLHGTVCDALLELLDQLQRRDTWQANTAWYRAGTELLDLYQGIKREQRLLDFSDLEWHAYQLLNRSEHAHWVQYKLDNRIDHLLIDEFQDTNPTQWRLILPLLEELAAGEAERPRSVFIVGDEKQSIYRFRRADARLLGAASDWLQTHLGSQAFSLARSRRSAPAIIECVNRVFDQAPLSDLLPNFETHATHNEALWGRVEVRPLIASDESAPDGTGEAAGLRNPLAEPREIDIDQRHYREGREIAARIQAMLAEPWILGSGANAHPAGYGDIMILLRNRTHVGEYERALRDAGIPYLGAARGALLASLEARDLEALLNTLIAPHNNLALAQVLRSPLFAASDADLTLLARHKPGDWMDRLLAVAGELPATHPLARAARLLSRWREQVGHLPVHDLLDRIFFEGDLLARYRSATPAAMQPQVLANLQRFLELALEIDSGRYPSLPRFLLHLEQLRAQAVDAPDDAPPETGGGDRVRFLTVHGAKGLEAPVVFVADSTCLPRDRSAWRACVDWPAQAGRPRYFVLSTRRSDRDAVTRGWLAEQQQAQLREDANLLYVALTRPRQVLIVTGSQPARGDQLGWYGLIRAGLQDDDDADPRAPLVLESGSRPPPPAVPAPAAVEAAGIDPHLSAPLAVTASARRIAPSRHADELPHPADLDADARLQGQAIHRFLELLAPPYPLPDSEALGRLAAELERSSGDPDLTVWLEEARRVIAHRDFIELFDPARYQHAYKEVPIQYLQGDTLIEGIIDRVVLHADHIRLVDYKSHRIAPAALAGHAAGFEGQMRYYAAGIRRLWPELPIRGGVLYTHWCEWVELPLDPLPGTEGI